MSVLLKDVLRLCCRLSLICRHSKEYGTGKLITLSRCNKWLRASVCAVSVCRMSKCPTCLVPTQRRVQIQQTEVAFEAYAFSLSFLNLIFLCKHSKSFNFNCSPSSTIHVCSRWATSSVLCFEPLPFHCRWSLKFFLYTVRVLHGTFGQDMPYLVHSSGPSVRWPRSVQVQCILNNHTKRNGFVERNKNIDTSILLWLLLEIIFDYP